MSRIARFWRTFFNALSLGMLALVVLVTCAVAARIGDFADLYWVEDMCRLILLWVGLLFVAAIQLDDRHIASDFLQPRWKWLRKSRDALKQISFMVIGVAWVIYGSVTVHQEMDMFGAGGMELPLYYFNTVIPVAGLLLVIVGIIRLSGPFGSRKVGETGGDRGVLLSE
jgi:TRAP-type C4-dicarboxylate transport system permease small subunit